MEEVDSVRSSFPDMPHTILKPAWQEVMRPDGLKPVRQAARALSSSFLRSLMGGPPCPLRQLAG